MGKAGKVIVFVIVCFVILVVLTIIKAAGGGSVIWLGAIYCFWTNRWSYLAGASVRLGREQKMLLPALCHTSLHPRLRQTAR